MHQIKTVPEDFIVEEILDYKSAAEGKHALFLLKKKDADTMFALDLIAKKARIRTKDIGYCGLKDKKAVTTQYISVPSSKKKKLDSLSFDENITLSQVDIIGEPLHLGDLTGNRFTITVRNLDAEMKLQNPRTIPNLFGEQRFSTQNAKVGRALIKKDFACAAELLESDGRYGSMITAMRAKEPNNYIGMLQVVPKHLLKFMIHAYQSLLWNKTAAAMANDGCEQQDIPLVGFSTRLQDPARRYYRSIMKEESVSPRDFIIRQLPDITSEGDERKLYMDVSDFSYTFSEDEMNKGKKKCSLSFMLKKGSYATTLIDWLFGQERS